MPQENPDAGRAGRPHHATEPAPTGRAGQAGGAGQAGRAGQAGQLVVLEPDAYRGRRIELLKDELVVGREAHCDVRFDDPYLSRAHAVLRRRGGTVYVQDLNSRAGTLVNGATARGDRPLRAGDIVALADLKLRFEPAGTEPGGNKPARNEPTRAERADPTLAAGVARYDIGEQQAGIINNIGRDQFIAYIQRRESFLRDIAAKRTKARWLIWIGFLCFVAGFAIFAAGILGFMSQVIDGLESGNPQPPDDIFGPDIFGVPSGLLGWVLAALGALLALVGVVLHVVATARRKRVDREFYELLQGNPHLPPQPPPRAAPV